MDRMLKAVLWIRIVTTVLAGATLMAVSAPRLAAQRLPGNVIPANYKLFLDPRITDGQFSGEETISVRLTEPLTEIVLNSLDLEISLAEITVGGKTQQAKVTYDRPSEMVRLALPGSVPSGPAALHLKFSGKLTESLRGLYLSKSPRRMYAVTQFEGTYARLMFPSFDEPGYKATFDLSVMADAGDTAISNGRLSADEAAGNRHKLTFATSPRMSTYLLALAVGDWQCLERTAAGVPIRVCAVPEKKEMGQFAMEVAVHSLEFYQQWYGIPYPFGKLDMVAIPDYEWGGMENTAAIFYRETALLVDERSASVLAKRGRATTIAHEIAHQWFGDLVTAAWWDDIWLNEGFASWMQTKPIQAWHPEWHLENNAVSSAQGILDLDSLASARAIHGDPKTSPEIKEMFDGITYQKGAAVLRMLESYVGPEVFRRGVNQYLKEHAQGNATSADFWRAMAQVSGKPVDKIMPGFVMQAGVPLVSISGTCRADRTDLSIQQQRFLITSEPAAPGSQLWQVPVCFKTADGKGSACDVITRKQQEAVLKGCGTWFFANRDAQGYYRVFYEDQSVFRSIAGAAEKELNTAERMALVEDSWAMTRAGKSRVVEFLYLAGSLRAERERPVLDLLAGHLGYVGGSLVPEDQKPKYQKFLREQFAPLAQELGWDTRPADSDEQKIMRASLLQILGSAGDAAAVAAARKITQQYLSAPESVEGTLVGPALYVAARTGDATLYNQLASFLASAKSTDHYINALFALATFSQGDLLQRTLDLIDQGKVRQQLYPALFSSLLSNPASRNATWDYMKGHWTDLAEKVSSFGGGGAVSALGNVCNAQMRDDVQQFFSTHPAIGAERTLRLSLERIDTCLKFKQLQQPSMTEWLAQQP
jgi:aminopeptidase N/puromycin-sensitive aminopeptidase